MSRRPNPAGELATFTARMLAAIAMVAAVMILVMAPADPPLAIESETVVLWSDQ